MDTFRAGYNRGSADKLAQRPMSVPSIADKEFRRGYKNGFLETASFAVEGLDDASARRTRGTRSPKSSAPASSDTSAPLGSADYWFVTSVGTWTGPSKGAREAMLVRVLQQVSASKKPLLVSFILRRGTNAPLYKSIGTEDILAYGIVQSVTGDGYDERKYETKITSYARYTPSGPAEGAAPSDAPPLGSVYVLGSNDLASMQQYEGEVAVDGGGFNVTLPEESSKTPKVSWKDILAATDDLDKKVAKFEEMVKADTTKSMVAWGPKNQSFLDQWNTLSAKIRKSSAMAKKGRPAEISPAIAEQEVLKARAAFAIVSDEWTTLPAKSKYEDVAKKESDVVKAGPLATTEDKKEEKKEDEPDTSKMVVKSLALPVSEPSWFEQNWKLVAAGGGAVAIGALVYMSMRKPG